MTDSNRRPSRCKRDALPAELIAPGSHFPRQRKDTVGSSRPDQFSESRNPLPGLNLACFDAAILIFSPVRGLRPSDAAREATEKVPKPTRRTSSPPFSASSIASKTASTALLASDFLMSVLLLTASTSSFLFTGTPWASGRTKAHCFAGEFRARLTLGQSRAGSGTTHRRAPPTVRALHHSPPISREAARWFPMVNESPLLSAPRSERVRLAQNHRPPTRLSGSMERPAPGRAAHLPSLLE